MTKRGRVRVETDRESPRTYDVGRNEEVTIRTRHERPKVTGGGGGGGGDFSLGGCLFAVIVLIVIAIKAINYTVNVVEVNVVKKFNPNYETRYEAAEKEAKKQKIEKEKTEREEKKKRENIEKLLARALKIKSVYNFGCEPEILFLSDKEIYAIIPLEEYGEKVLIKTTDGGENWKVILAGTENRYFRRLSVESVNGKKIITVFLNSSDSLRAWSVDGGKTWKYLNRQNEEVKSPPKKNGKITLDNQ